MWCHYFEKNNHKKADFRAIQLPNSKFKKVCFEAKAGPGKKSLAFLFIFQEIHALKTHLELKPEKTARIKNRKLDLSPLLLKLF
jgi:hypothetical protein